MHRRASVQRARSAEAGSLSTRWPARCAGTGHHWPHMGMRFSAALRKLLGHHEQDRGTGTCAGGAFSQRTTLGLLLEQQAPVSALSPGSPWPSPQPVCTCFFTAVEFASQSRLSDLEWPGVTPNHRLGPRHRDLEEPLERRGAGWHGGWTWSWVARHMELEQRSGGTARNAVCNASFPCARRGGQKRVRQATGGRVWVKVSIQ